MSGILRGIDGVHTWTSPDGTVLRLNELDSVTTGAAVWPRYRLLDVDHGYAEAGDTSHKRVRQTGSVVHPDYRGSRVHSLTIEVMGRTIDELREGERDLRAAFADQSAEGRMDVGLHPLNDDYDAADNVYFNAKALSLQPGTDKPDTDLSPQLGFRREWVLGLRNHSGRYYQELSLAGFKAAILDLGPSLYWPLDATDGATDQSGNGRNGTGAGGITIGGAAALSAVAGDSATNFDGTDDRITSSYDPFVNSTTRTFLGVASRDASASADALFSSNDAAARANFGLGLGNQDAVFALSETSGTYAFNEAWPGNAQSVVWALVVSETPDTANLFLDGVSVAGEVALATASGWGTGNFMLGVIGSGLLDPFDGKMGHVTIFERGLSALEIAGFNEWATTGLRSYW